MQLNYNIIILQNYTREIVTLMGKFPFSPKCCTILVSNIKQSLLPIVEATPSWMLLGLASHVSRRPWPLSSNLYVKFSACFWVPIIWTIAKNCWWFSCLSCFSSTSIKLCSKQHCIITQSTAPGKLMSVARKTMSSPCNVVILLCVWIRWPNTSSSDPCHLHDVPGHGHAYGRNSQTSSCSRFSVCSRRRTQPELQYLQGKRTFSATFSIAKFLMLPSGPLQLGQHCTFGLQLEQIRCPLLHCNIGGRT